jgi:hypothetical protein
MASLDAKHKLDFEIKMKNNSLALFDAKHNLILKTPLSKNRKFQINMTIVKVMCLSAVETEDKNWIYGMLDLAI